MLSPKNATIVMGTYCSIFSLKKNSKCIYIYIYIFFFFNFIFAHKSLKFYGDDITSLNFKLYKFKNLCIT